MRVIYSSVIDCIGHTPLVYLRRLFPQSHIEVIAKLELLNPGGSVKDRPARYIIEKGLSSGIIYPGSHLIESTSGNFGIALAMVANHYHMQLTCVVDPNITSSNLRILRAMGANIDMVQELDEQGGYLGTRIKRVHELLQTTSHSYWINQYANEQNWRTHYYTTAEEIIQQVDGPIDYAVICVSTTGTIRGLATRLREAYPHIHIIAVDAVGSVIFGAQASKRLIPGMGASRVPELLKPECIDEVIYISDEQSVQGCHDLLLEEQIFAGGSSGSAIAALQKFIPSIQHPSRVITLLPDRGDRYLDTIYSRQWVSEHLGRLSQPLQA